MSIKNKIVVLGLLLFLVACNKETLKDKITEVPQKITWEEYYKYCSSGNLYREDNFKKLKEKEVIWKGTVIEVKDAPDMAQLHGRYHTQVVLVRMNPSDAVFSDIELRLKRDLAEEIKIFKKDDPIEFKGQIKFIGSGISSNVVNISAIRRSKVEKEKKKKRKNPFK